MKFGKAVMEFILLVLAFGIWGILIALLMFMASI